MPNVPIRIRHPRGTTTIELDLETSLVDDLRVLIFSATEIPPSEQDIKYGYPPKSIPQVEGTLSTIPIGRGEQITVTASAVATPSHSASIPATQPVSAPSVKSLNQALSAPTPPPAETSNSSAASQAFASNDVSVPLQNATSAQMGALRQNGSMQLRKVPDDNSCLFSAVGVVLVGGIEAAQQLRTVIADAIDADPEMYSDIMLGMPRADYKRTILKRDTWGGAIELSIFAKHFRTEICSFDVATGRCDRFGQDEYDQRCVLIYSGIHYDAVSVVVGENTHRASHTTVFPISEEVILPTARVLAAKLKEQHYYTDTANFDLRCGICGEGLKGEAGAREHAMQTGHVEFGEY